MEHLRSRLRYIVPTIILLVIAATICMHSHHHDCYGMIRVALVETHSCHHHHSPSDGHHPHGCDGGCSVMTASAIIQSDHSDAVVPLAQHDCFNLPFISSFHTYLGQSHKVEYPRLIVHERLVPHSVLPLRGPPQC